MSSKNRTYQRDRIERDQDIAKGNYGRFLNPIIDRNPGLVEAGKKERAYLTGGYQNFAETGGLKDEDIQRLRDSYGSSAADGFTVPDFAEERTGYRNLVETGGYSNDDVKRVRAQAASSAPSFYGALKDQMGLRQSNLGSNASANAGINFKLARSAAQGAAADKLGANIGLAESQRSGRITGLEGLTNTSALTGDFGLRKAGMQDTYNRGRADLEGGILGMQQGGKKFGLGGLQGLYDGPGYGPQVQNESLWLKSLGQFGNENQGYHGLNLRNDEINKPGASFSNILGSAAGLWPAIKDLFKGKKSKPTASSGGGGGVDGTGPGAGGRDLFRVGWGDPALPPNRGEDVSEHQFPGWRDTARPGESFGDWYHRTKGKM